MTSALPAAVVVLTLLILCLASRPAEAGSLTELQAQAAGETFVNKLLGTDCFTKSLSIINKDCSKLDSEKKSRLAMGLAICHLDQLGLPAFTCGPSMTLKQCADNIKDDRQYTTYMEFLSNVDTMCLFLQSQDFQRHTEFMINSLYSSSQHAAEQLEAVDSHLEQSLLTMKGLDQTLGGVATAQLQQLQLAEENLKSVGQLQDDSQALHTQLEHALQNEELVLTKQNEVLNNLASLDEEEAARAQIASFRWQEAQEQASELLVQQQHYQQVQQQLLGDLRQLSDSSAGLRTALDVVVQYEERGAAMLTHMLGSTCSVQDLLGYVLAAVGIAAMGLSKATKGARLPLMVLFALSVIAERAMMHSMHRLLEIDHTGQVGLSLPVFGIPVNLKSMVRRLCLATAVAQVMWAVWKHSDLERETIRVCKRMEAQQQEQSRSQAAFNQELREVQKQQWIEIMAMQRSSNPSAQPATPTRTPSGQLDDADHVPQLQWQSDEADDYNQQLWHQLQKQHNSDHDAKSTRNKGRHVSHATDARKKIITQAEKVSKLGSQASHSTKGHRNSMGNMSRESPSSQDHSADDAQRPDFKALREHKSAPQQQGSCCLNTQDSADAEHIMHHNESVAKGTVHSHGSDSRSCLGMNTPAKAGPTGGKRQRAASEIHVVTDNRGELHLAVTQQGKRARK